MISWLVFINIKGVVMVVIVW